MHPRCDPKVWTARGGGQDDRRSAHALRWTCRRAGGSDQSLKRSHGRVLWAIDALMCSGVGPSRFVARWFQSIAPNCMRCGQCACARGRQKGPPGPTEPQKYHAQAPFPGTSRGKGTQSQHALRLPGVCPRAGPQKMLEDVARRLKTLRTSRSERRGQNKEEPYNTS